VNALTDLQTYSETALASYAQALSIGLGVNRAELIRAGMSAAQATSFDSRWSVLAQSEGHLSGFSAVLLQNVQSGQKALAIRGTDGAADFITDFVNISIYGSVLGMPQYMALEAFYADLLGTGQLAASDQLVLTGHSLGGFLAQAFTARHPSVVSAAYTFNAPGFGGGLAQAVEFLGVTDGSIAHSKIVNIHATDGLSVIAGLGAMLGSTEMVRIEPGTAIQNHSIKTVTDALAVQAAYQQLQPGLSTTQIGAYVGFVQAGQPAEVKLETFPFTRYGTVQATVVRLSADAVTDEKLGAIFPATLKLDRTYLNVDGKRIALAPGMNLTAEIKTGERRVIEYLLSPLQRRVGESLKER
jgi:pimeloyl-ACP methyl ester carboxylesterase